MEKNKLFEKLGKIMKSVERIEKDAKNSHQNYEYASEKVIKEVFHKEFADNGILFTLDTSDPQILGSVLFIQCEYTFTDTESGESKSGKFLGSGHTRDDKGYYAAVTGAIKYILTSQFLVPTGDDPENDKNESKVTYDASVSQETPQQGSVSAICYSCSSTGTPEKLKAPKDFGQGEKNYVLKCSCGKNTWLSTSDVTN